MSKTVLQPAKQRITFRPIHSINIANLREYIEHAESMTNPPNVHYVSNTMRTMLL